MGVEETRGPCTIHLEEPFCPLLLSQLERTIVLVASETKNNKEITDDAVHLTCILGTGVMEAEIDLPNSYNYFRREFWKYAGPRQNQLMVLPMVYYDTELALSVGSSAQYRWTELETKYIAILQVMLVKGIMWLLNKELALLFPHHSLESIMRNGKSSD